MVLSFCQPWFAEFELIFLLFYESDDGIVYCSHIRLCFIFWCICFAVNVSFLCSVYSLIWISSWPWDGLHGRRRVLHFKDSCHVCLVWSYRFVLDYAEFCYLASRFWFWYVLVQLVKPPYEIMMFWGESHSIRWLVVWKNCSSKQAREIVWRSVTNVHLCFVRICRIKWKWLFLWWLATIQISLRQCITRRTAGLSFVGLWIR